MKKFFSLAVAILILSGLAQAGTLKMVKPNGGENWESGSSRQIFWTANGIAEKVKLILYRNGSRLGRIAGGLNAAAGAYSWTTGSYEGGVAPDGDGYTIAVQTADDAVSDRSDAPFSIGAAATPGGTGQTVTKLSDRKVQFVKPDLSKATPQAPLVAKIPRIERIDPSFLSNAGWALACAHGQAFGATRAQLGQYVYLWAEANSVRYKLNATDWQDTRICFSRDPLMKPGDYLVYIADERPQFSPLTNKVPFRIEASEYSYINFVQPGSIITGEAQHPIEIHGFDFNKPHDSRGATVWFNGIPRPVTVESWSDGLVRGRFSTLLIPPATRCEIVVHHIQAGVTHYSNRETFYVNPR